MDNNFTWLPVSNSSQITRVGYSETKLAVEFKSTGRVYESTKPVDARKIAENIQGAPSPGKYFNANVAGVYDMRPAA